MLWLSSLQQDSQEDKSQEETSNPSSEETRVNGFLRNFSLSDLHLADSLMKSHHVRRRSADALYDDIDKGRNHSRSKTVPSSNDKEAILLFNKFEVDQLRRKSYNFGIEKKINNSHCISDDSSLRSNEPDFQIPNLASFLELAERISKFAIGAYGTNMMKILGYPFIFKK